ncbi:MAG: choice-of-anchor H family protein [Gammaproteobacteria bacterium]|nr:choice-of-anchor H family protein [Gammaproteobacteria bacterium]
MDTTARIFNWTKLLLAMLLVAGLMIVSVDAFAAGVDAEARLSVTKQSTREQRDNGAPGKVSEDEYPTLATSAELDEKGTRSSVRSKATVQSSSAANIDFWFYTADIVLFNDFDEDGYYHGIDLLFDADTYFSSADVYAVVYLSFEGGPWNEYAATDDFTIFGASSDDEYVLVTELLAGYPTGSYDVLIELFDAYDDSFLAYFGPDDTSELAFLPIEDAGRDAAIVTEVIVVDHHEHGGGALGWWFILALGLAVLTRRRPARCA